MRDSTLRDILAEYFMATSNDFITIQDKIEALIALKVQEARIDELRQVNFYINAGGMSFTEYYKDRLSALQKTKGDK